MTPELMGKLLEEMCQSDIEVVRGPTAHRLSLALFEAESMRTADEVSFTAMAKSVVKKTGIVAMHILTASRDFVVLADGEVEASYDDWTITGYVAAEWMRAFMKAKGLNGFVRVRYNSKRCDGSMRFLKQGEPV